MKIFISGTNLFILHVVAYRSLIRNPAFHLHVMNQVCLDRSLRYHTGLSELLLNKLACFYGDLVLCKDLTQFPETEKSRQCSALPWLVSIVLRANQPVFFTIFYMAELPWVAELALNLYLAMVSYRSLKANCGKLKYSNNFTVRTAG